jgi:hypothetical protein
VDSYGDDLRFIVVRLWSRHKPLLPSSIGTVPPMQVPRKRDIAPFTLPIRDPSVGLVIAPTEFAVV